MTRCPISATHIIRQKACGKYIQKQFAHGNITILMDRDMNLRGIIGTFLGEGISQQAVHPKHRRILLLKFPMLLLYK
ncbi:MAG: hypothetical protein R3B95_06200 [Nitrospirales bacterium]|nr:hypothetical protein [Nitrospirales bacterium]